MLLCGENMTTPSSEIMDPYSTPIEKIDVSNPMIFHRNEQESFFKRLREEDPVHFCADSPYGPYWSITRFKDIMEVDTNHKVFSSANAVSLDDRVVMGPDADSTPIGGFIVMDPPEHDFHRKIVSPGLGPANLARLEHLMRERTQGVLNELPIGEEFDWVEKVSVELTMLMLATLLDFPLDDRDKLKRWSDMQVASPGNGVTSWEQRDRELKDMAQAFLELREMRKTEEPKSDLVSILTHSSLAQGMTDRDFTSNVALLIVGGNETTRNSMSGGILAFHEYPEQWAKLKADPSLIDSAVPEIIRWQTPLMSQGRRAVEDYELGGKMIRKGDKVMMWYVSGNRDEEAIPDAGKFIIDRQRPRQHLSFGFGIHRCLGNRLAEMQLRVLLEELIAKPWSRIEVLRPVQYAKSHGVRSINSLPVRIHS